MTKRKIALIVAIVLILLIPAGLLFYELRFQSRASEITAEEAEKIVNNQFDAMAKELVPTEIAKRNTIKVNSLSYGIRKDVILDCTVTGIDVYPVISKQYDSFFSSATKSKSGREKSALDFLVEYEYDLLQIVEQAPEITTDCEIILYETEKGFSVYAEDEVTDIVYGGTVSVIKEVKNIKTYTKDGEKHDIASPNINKGFMQCLEIQRNTEKPDVSGPIMKFINGIKDDFNKNFIQYDRWKTIFTGLWATIKLTIFALLIGVVLGFIVAFIRCTYLKSENPGVGLEIIDRICRVYLTVIRGTPVVVQIMIIYFVIFMPVGVDKFLSAVICFGLNSGAYVAEIVRGGIMSIDAGQEEAGRSLGFGYMQTMGYIILPQAFKNVLPALANEFIVLLKETSIAFYIGLRDLMYAGNAIRAATYSPFMPLVTVAIIYLIMVLILSKLVGILERRLKNSER